MSVLDLPLEEQKRIAKEVFQMPFEEWMEDMKTSLKVGGQAVLGRQT